MRSESRRRISRRHLLRSAFTTGSGLLAAYAVGCGSDDNDEPTATPVGSDTPTATAAPETPTQPATTPGDQQLRWQMIPVSGPAPSPRHDHSLVTNGKSLFLFGGRNAAPLNDLWSFDLASRAWKQIPSTGPAAPLRAQRRVRPDFGKDARLRGPGRRVLQRPMELRPLKRRVDRGRRSRQRCSLAEIRRGVGARRRRASAGLARLHGCRAASTTHGHTASRRSPGATCRRRRGRGRWSAA